MSERKVLNKYYPPDFDPAAIPRRRMPKDQQVKVRLMTPFSMQCETCHDYIYKGKKFNARKEVAGDEEYLGIKILRFYIKCPRCAAEITFKTDPKNSDYLAEHGAVRNFEPWREERITGEDTVAEREQEEENDPMKALENRTLDSKREMDILDALDEIRTRNARNERMHALIQDPTAAAGTAETGDGEGGAVVDYEAEALRLAEEEDDKLARSIFHSAHSGDTVKRLAEDEEPDLATVAATALSEADGSGFTIPALPSRKRKATSSATPNKLGVVIKRKNASTASTSAQKPSSSTHTLSTSKSASTSSSSIKIPSASVTTSPATNPAQSKPISKPAPALSALLGDYGSDSDGSNTS